MSGDSCAPATSGICNPSPTSNPAKWSEHDHTQNHFLRDQDANSNGEEMIAAKRKFRERVEISTTSGKDTIKRTLYQPGLVIQQERPLDVYRSYPTIEVQRNWHHILRDDCKQPQHMSNTFGLALNFLRPEPNTFFFSFSLWQLFIIPDRECDIKMLDSSRCHINVVGGSLLCYPAAPLFKSFIIVAPFETIYPIPQQQQHMQYHSDDSMTNRSGSLSDASLCGNSLIEDDVASTNLLRKPNNVPVTAVTCSDNLYFAGYKNGEIRLTPRSENVAELAILPAVLSEHTGAVTKIALFPGENKFVSSSRDGSAIIWDIKTGYVLQVLKGHREAITDCFVIDCEESENILVCPSSAAVITTSLDGTIRIWEAESGRQVREIKVGEPVLAAVRAPWRGSALPSTFNIGGENTNAGDADSGTSKPNGPLTPAGVFACQSGAVHALSLGFREPSVPIQSLRNYASATSLSFLCPELLAVGTSNGSVCIWNVITGQIARSVDFHGSKVTHVMAIQRTHIAVVLSSGCVTVLRTLASFGLPVDFVLTGSPTGGVRCLTHSCSDGAITIGDDEGVLRRYLSR